MEVGPLLASGRDADVFALGPTRVLRRYRDAADVALEVEAMTYVAEHGYPVPAIYEASGRDIVMERLDGSTMLDALAAHDVRDDEAGAILADLHNRLRALPPRTSSGGASHVLHLDLHPDNVMLCSRGRVVVIDWRNTADGPRDLDTALSALILGEAGVGGGRRAESARGILAAFLAAVDGQPATMLDEAVSLRSADANMVGDRATLLERSADLVRESAHHR